jgi:hypothetical protein
VGDTMAWHPFEITNLGIFYYQTILSPKAFEAFFKTLLAN